MLPIEGCGKLVDSLAIDVCSELRKQLLTPVLLIPWLTNIC